MNDVISTGKIGENTRLHLVFSPDIFLVEMTSFMFLSQHRDTQAIFYWLKVTHKKDIKSHKDWNYTDFRGFYRTRNNGEDYTT